MVPLTDKVILREPKLSELKELVPLYQHAFTKHNVFKRDPKSILDYLQEQHHKNVPWGGGFIVAVMGNKVAGGILLKREGQDLHGEHTLWGYNHLGVSKEVRGKGIGVSLMKEAENKIRVMIAEKKFKTAKVELNVSENEKEIITFYKKFGFSVEGKLRSHYRWKEVVYVMGKEISTFF